MGVIARIGGWEIDPATGRGIWTDEVARIHDLAPGERIDLERITNLYRDASRRAFEDAVKGAIEHGTPYDLELELHTAPGGARWIRAIGQPTRKEGHTVWVRGAFQDITERVRTKRHIEDLNRILRAIRNVMQLIIHERDPDTLIREGCRLLVENSGYASALIVLTDEAHRPVSWARSGAAESSSALERMLRQGALPPCCVPNHPDRRLVSLDGRPDFCGHCPIWTDDACSEAPLICAPLTCKETRFGCLTAAKRIDTRVDEEELGLFSETAEEIAYALNAIQKDIEHRTAKRKSESLENQLIQAQKMESVGRLAGGVAHAFNNMLGVIIGYAELCKHQVDPEDRIRADLDEIISAAKRSTNITRQLLAFARQQPIDPKALDLNDTIESMLKMLRRLIGEDINLSWNPKEGLWPIRMDPTQIDQILANLCVNARDAIRDIGNITIETHRAAVDDAFCAEHPGFSPGDFAVLSVSDDGCGMPKEMLEKIFEPFYSTKGTGKGTGLGLSTVYGIVKQNDGFIDVYSEPGKGTPFRIYLPRHRGPMAAPARARRRAIPRGHGETVLAVEDELAILVLTEKILSGLGYRVLLAKSPREALEAVESHSGDIALVITDVVMPEMNGRELIDRLRKRIPGLTYLFMSGYTADVIAHRGVLEEGVNFIQKPFTSDDLAVKVRAALDNG